MFNRTKTPNNTISDLVSYFNLANNIDKNIIPGSFVKLKEYNFVEFKDVECQKCLGYVISHVDNDVQEYAEVGKRGDILLAIDSRGKIIIKIYDSRLFRVITNNEYSQISKPLIDFVNDLPIDRINGVPGALVRPRSGTTTPGYNLSGPTAPKFISPFIIITTNDDTTVIAGYTGDGTIHEIKWPRFMLAPYSTSQ